MAAALAGAALSGCGGGATGSAGGDDRPVVVATTTIWADVTQMVACDGTFEVRSIVPAGGDAHAYEPSLRDRETLDGAALVVANGLGLEELLTDTLDDVEAGGRPTFTVADHVDRLGDDPHVWFDPTRVAAALPALGEALVDAGADATATQDCVTAAQAALAAVDAEVRELLAAVPAERRVLVTNHDALGYFADRYGFEILGTVLPSASTLTEASPGDLEALSASIEAAGVPAIFTEVLHSSTDAEALAARLGVEVVELHTDSLGEPSSGAETYTGLLRADAEAIARALAS